MNFEVTIDQFSGPLDLMLYLIKDKKLDLFNLNIVELANQYLDFINSASEQKLEIASEYLSELAGLLEFKSKKLLPRDTTELDDAQQPESETDLVRRLIEYQRYKEVSLELSQRFYERSLHYAKPLASGLFKTIRHELNETISFEQTPYDLIQAMAKVMARFKLAHPHDIRIENVELSVDDRIETLRFEFAEQKTMTLTDLLHKARTLHYLIVTFLAVLDMLRMDELRVSFQGEEVYLKGVV